MIGHRRAHQVSLGDGGNAVMTRKMPAHGNFAKYAAVGLVLLLAGAGAVVLHLTSLVLLAGRPIHGIGFAI